MVPKRHIPYIYPYLRNNLKFVIFLLKLLNKKPNLVLKNIHPVLYIDKILILSKSFFKNFLHQTQRF